MVYHIVLVLVVETSTIQIQHQYKAFLPLFKEKCALECKRKTVNEYEICRASF